MNPTDTIPHKVGIQAEVEQRIREGATARLQLKNADANPYPAGSVANRQWHTGWLRPAMYVEASR